MVGRGAGKISEGLEGQVAGFGFHSKCSEDLPKSQPGDAA